MAKVFLSSLTCHNKNETGSDEIRLEGSGFRWPQAGHASMDINKQVKLDKVIDFDESYVITLTEDDKYNDDKLGSVTFNAQTTPNPNEKFTVTLDKEDAHYSLEYFYLPNSFKTVYIRGFHCERDTLGIDLDVIELITGIYSTLIEATSIILDAIPYPGSDKIGAAYDAASKVCGQVPKIAEWIAKNNDNPDELFITRANYGCI